MKECEVCENHMSSAAIDICERCWRSWWLSDTASMNAWKAKKRIELSTKYLEEALTDS